MTTCRKIVNWRTYLRFPPEVRGGPCCAVWGLAVQHTTHPVLQHAVGGRFQSAARQITLLSGLLACLQAEAALTPAARDFISRLLCDVEERLGRQEGLVWQGAVLPAGSAWHRKVWL